MNTAGTGGSQAVKSCQVCGCEDLSHVIFLGYLPPVNTMQVVTERFTEQKFYPAEALKCRNCSLVQLGLIVDPNILFPPEYPYTSGTTKILRENFAQLYSEVMGMLNLKQSDLVVDIGSNDGTLLGNFMNGGHQVCGIEPTDTFQIANKKGIFTINKFFDDESVGLVKMLRGYAKVITAANVFAHIEDVNSIVKGIVSLLDEDGVFISESHYLASLLKTNQYDTIYHEHLRYYSLESLKFLLEKHGLEVFHARHIPTHGGSIRVYAARPGKFRVRDSVGEMLAEEKLVIDNALQEVNGSNTFERNVLNSKMELRQMLADIAASGKRVYGVGAPSRASTLVNYVGLDSKVVQCILEISGSYKIGKYMPGTDIPIVNEKILSENPPDYLLLLSWHIADELIPKLALSGFKGEFIIPLPQPIRVKL